MYTVVQRIKLYGLEVWVAEIRADDHIVTARTNMLSEAAAKAWIRNQLTKGVTHD